MYWKTVKYRNISEMTRYIYYQVILCNLSESNFLLPYFITIWLVTRAVLYQSPVACGA